MSHPVLHNRAYYLKNPEDNIGTAYRVFLNTNDVQIPRFKIGGHFFYQVPYYNNLQKKVSTGFISSIDLVINIRYIGTSLYATFTDDQMNRHVHYYVLQVKVTGQGVAGQGNLASVPTNFVIDCKEAGAADLDVTIQVSISPFPYAVLG